MSLKFESYLLQRDRWPASGRHILAQFDAETIVVYQAFRPEIAAIAAKRGRFGDGFSLDRMSWIKPNFLWMMYRSGWGTKEGQQAVLAIRIRRIGFDRILAASVHSTFDPLHYRTREDWSQALGSSTVRLQWDPDHAPSGAREARRAIQLGLAGGTLRSYAREWTVGIEDITECVASRRGHVQDLAQLETPREDLYPVGDPEIARRLGLGGT